MKDTQETAAGLARSSATASSAGSGGSDAASDRGKHSPYYATKDVAPLYGVHDWTIRQWVGKGKFPAPIPLFKGSWKWSRQVIHEHMRSLGIEPPAEVA